MTTDAILLGHDVVAEPEVVRGLLALTGQSAAAERPARTYSGGQRRRLELASSLLTRPRILFLDEPTTGPDPRGRNEIWAAVRELRRAGTALLLTAHLAVFVPLSVWRYRGIS